MGWGGMGMPPRISEQRLQENIGALRDIINTRPSSVVRNTLEGSTISKKRLKYPPPSIGYRSGKLTVTGYLKGLRGFKALIVKCDCSQEEYTVDNHNFKNFKSTRCSLCAKKAANKKRYWLYSAALPDDTHRTRLLNRLSAAISRCHNKSNANYKHYGERGIYVFQKWREDKAVFLRYVQTLDGWNIPEFEMDRVDNNKGYEPNNIRFVSRSSNLKNKRQIADLEDRIRHLELRLKEQVHHTD